ncbi:hypothetical protein, partial [Mycobacterium tuberculosis]|uniref:hypothetical protein n=1 Tax=Mycobacterium tuberculosis TaxID=1773 RepID=UPI003C6DF35B
TPVGPDPTRAAGAAGSPNTAGTTVAAVVGLGIEGAAAVTAGAAATARAAVATPAAIEADVALPAVSTGAAGT